MLLGYDAICYSNWTLFFIPVVVNLFNALHNALHTAVGIWPQSASQSSVLLLAGIIPAVLLLLANVVTGVVAVLITRHCYKKTSQKSSPSKGEDVYEQVEGPKTYEDIVMTDCPAYGPVK